MQQDLRRLVDMTAHILERFDEEGNIARTVTVGLLENLIFGGFCAQGFRNRLFAALDTVAPPAPMASDTPGTD